MRHQRVDLSGLVSAKTASEAHPQSGTRWSNAWVLQISEDLTIVSGAERAMVIATTNS